MRIYNVAGWLLMLAYALGCVYFAPPAMAPAIALLIGAAYFVGSWLIGGVYLSCVIHMGIAHRALDYQEWFIKAITIVNNTVGIYVNPMTWVNRHRLHHKFSDQPGDPNKLAADGFWRTLYLCLMPYKSQPDMMGDEIFKSWTFRIVSHPLYSVAAQLISFGVLWLLVRDLRFAAAMWIGMRIFALWINMIQNYWTHDRRYGYRRYHDEHDNAMNIGEWLPVTATFSACLQNNHHHSPGFLRLSHEEWEYDLGFIAVRVMKALGLVRATPKGATLPKDVPLTSVGF